ncbi:conserved hypothetical protein [Aeromicrobium sp. 9AM]|nr:conserved hypothetical protein [Aeromicrobium sp. 9AM]
MSQQESLTCRRCGGSVRNADDGRNIFEHMHYVCFHYEFEHGDEDVDFDCGSPGCPSGMLPPIAPSPAAEAALDEVTDALRDPYSADAWHVDRRTPSSLALTRGSDSFLVVITDAPPDRDSGIGSVAGG